MALWKTDKENPQRLFLHGSDVYKVSFAKYPNYAISAGEGGRVKIWHIIEAQVKHVILMLIRILSWRTLYLTLILVILEYIL
jgi:hypothetical protein